MARILVSLKIGDKELIDDASIASSFNPYFSSVFTTEDFTNLPSLEPLVFEKKESYFLYFCGNFKAS